MYFLKFLNLKLSRAPFVQIVLIQPMLSSHLSESKNTTKDTMAESTCFLPTPDNPSNPNNLNFLDFSVPQGQKVLLEALHTYNESKSRAIQKWMREKMNQPGSTLRKGENNPVEDEKLLREYFYHFSKILFDGRIHEAVKDIGAETEELVDAVHLQMEKRGDESIEQWEKTRAGWRGRTRIHSNHGYNPNDIEVIITMWEQPLLSNPVERMTAYAGTLMHEMVHAYMALYCCMCTKCTSLYEGVDDMGATGHGVVFQRILFEMEKFCRDVLHFPLKLGREYSFAGELFRMKAPLNKQICGELGLDIEKIEAVMKRLERGEIEVN